MEAIIQQDWYANVEKLRMKNMLNILFELILWVAVAEKGWVS